MEETLGKRIAARRKALNLTQDALAEQLGITAQAVSKWENGQSCPDITMLPRLAEIFSCTTDELLGIAPKEIPPQASVPESPAEAPESRPQRLWHKALASPGAAFGCWLFLTGVVALIDAVRLPPYDLADISLIHIALCCGLFVFGLFSLFHRFSPLRLGCALAGGVFIFNLVTEPSISDMDWYVPLLAGVALFGLDLFFDALLGRKPSLAMGHRIPSCMKNSFETEADSFTCATSFGEDNHPITMTLLSRGKAEVSFGDLTLDLTQCESFAENCQLELRSSFGELTVLIPRRCRAETSVLTAFAACDTFGAPDTDANARIYVNGNASFGRIVIRYI